MYTIYKDKLYQVKACSINNKTNSIFVIERNNEEFGVFDKNLIHVPDHILKIKKDSDVRWKGKKYRVLKVNRKTADICLTLTRSSQKAKYTIKKLKRNRTPSGGYYYDKRRVPLSELKLWDIKRIGYDYFLAQLMEIVIKVHQDLIDRIFSDKHKLILHNTTISLGKKTDRLLGWYNRIENHIRINLPNVEGNKQECLFYNLLRKMKTIWHEILHIKYHKKYHVHPGILYHYEKQFRAEQCEVYLDQIKRFK